MRGGEIGTAERRCDGDDGVNGLSVLPTACLSHHLPSLCAISFFSLFRSRGVESPYVCAPTAPLPLLIHHGNDPHFLGRRRTKGVEDTQAYLFVRRVLHDDDALETTEFSFTALPVPALLRSQVEG